MASPSWLPPLNSHREFDVYVKASQPGKALYDPSISWREFSVKIKVCVNFYSDDKNSKERIFEGLSVENEFGIYCNEVSPNSFSSWQIITSMMDATFIPFNFDGAIWRERQLGSTQVDELATCCTLFDDCNLIEKVSDFLCCMKLQKRNENKSILPFKLEIEKMVTIPDQELKAWNSWYAEKKRNPNFERDFREAIGRPRTDEEFISETHHPFKGATESSIQELEEVTVIPDDSIPKTNCPICVEEFFIGSQATRLPCLHTFHGNCIIKWLRDHHVCPLCRFTMPID